MKVYPFKIPKKHNERLLLQIDSSNRFYDKLHQHDEIQLSYIRYGKGKLIVGNQVTTFETGDFVALGANLPHVFLSAEGVKKSHMESLFFTKKSFGDTFFNNEEMKQLQPFWSLLGYGFKIKDRGTYFDYLFSNCTNEDKFALFVNLLELLKYLSKIANIETLADGHTTRISNNQGKRLQQVFDFAMQNFQTDIQLEQAAEKAHMTKNSFCRFFKQRTNKTFFQFLAEIRIQHASVLLKDNPECSVSEIAAQSGYPTLSNFNRQFKELTKLTPGMFRKQFKTHFEG